MRITGYYRSAYRLYTQTRAAVAAAQKAAKPFIVTQIKNMIERIEDLRFEIECYLDPSIMRNLQDLRDTFEKASVVAKDIHASMERLTRKLEEESTILRAESSPQYDSALAIANDRNRPREKN